MAKVEWQTCFDPVDEESVEIISTDLTYKPCPGEPVRTFRGLHRIAKIDDYHHRLDVVPGTAIQPLTI